MRPEQFDVVMTSWLESRAAGGDVDEVIRSDTGSDPAHQARASLAAPWFVVSRRRGWRRSRGQRHRRRVLVVLLLLLALALVVVAIGSRPAWPRRSGSPRRARRVCRRRRPVVGEPGWIGCPSNDERPRIEGFPAHSPDGTMIAFKRLPDEGAATGMAELRRHRRRHGGRLGPRVVDRTGQEPEPDLVVERQPAHRVLGRRRWRRPGVRGGGRTRRTDQLRQVTRDARQLGTGLLARRHVVAFVRGFPESSTGSGSPGSTPDGAQGSRPFRWPRWTRSRGARTARRSSSPAGEGGDHSIWTVAGAAGSSASSPTAREPDGRRVVADGIADLPSSSASARRTRPGHWPPMVPDPVTIGVGGAWASRPAGRPTRHRVLVVDAGSLTGRRR